MRKLARASNEDGGGDMAQHARRVTVLFFFQDDVSQESSKHFGRLHSVLWTGFVDTWNDQHARPD